MQYDAKYLVATAERALKTFFQTLLALLGTDAAGVLSADWSQVLAVSLSAALLSVITSLSSAGFGAPGPSLANESIEPETVIVEVPAAPKKRVAAKAPAKKTATARKTTARK